MQATTTGPAPERRPGQGRRSHWLVASARYLFASHLAASLAW